MELTATRLHWAIPAFFRARSKAFSSETGLMALPLVMKNSFGIISEFSFSFIVQLKLFGLITLRFLLINRNQDRIIIKSILNFSTAFRECGSLAGIVITSPLFKRKALPEMTIFAWPSMM